MKKLTLSALVIGLMAFSSCGSDDDNSSDDNSNDGETTTVVPDNCVACDNARSDGTAYTAIVCDNGDGTTSSTVEGQTLTANEPLEITFEEHLSALETISGFTCTR